ncbi:MAG TPA: DUF2934 domain-containing protein [Geminicoccus sp.]|jgi:hypothetical protein|uniref:DUF2934 domain-containing protein n=1 Tax=Geminicoccus sp. TaxID=2024832 RepID=UPI002E32C55E|nr:DUF2934 domain-containing protein [Geminicoccus sp.]HEX2529717.1 DUF2934 domain-containing protein [Geminicoccus sp.]
MSDPGQADEAILQKVRERAYQLWETEGRPEGRDHEFWFRAEQEAGLVTGEERGGEQAPSSDLEPDLGAARTDDILPS